MSDTQQMKRLSVWVPAATVDRLDKITKKNSGRGWKRADAIREALADYVETEDPGSRAVDKPVPTLQEIVKGMIFEQSGTGIGDTSDAGILAMFEPADKDAVLAALWDLVASGMVICREGSYGPGPRSGAPESRDACEHRQGIEPLDDLHFCPDAGSPESKDGSGS